MLREIRCRGGGRQLPVESKVSALGERRVGAPGRHLWCCQTADSGCPDKGTTFLELRVSSLVLTIATFQTNDLKRMWTSQPIKSAVFSSLASTVSWKGLTSGSDSRLSVITSRQPRCPEASAYRPWTQPTNSRATMLIWTGNSIARWISWSVCNDCAGRNSAAASQYQFRKTEIDPLPKQSQEAVCFQWRTR